MSKESNKSTKKGVKKGTKDPLKKNKYSKAVVKEVLAWVASGKSVADLRKIDPYKYPLPQLVASWARNDLEFRKEYHEAQHEGIYNAQDELRHLISNPPKLENMPNEDVRVLGQLTTQWKTKIASLEKYIGKFGSIYDQAMQDKPKQLEVKGDTAPKIVVVNYSNDSNSGALIKTDDDYVAPTNKLGQYVGTVKFSDSGDKENS